jgi:ribonuclease HII
LSIVGRGPLAGPAVTCACWLRPEWKGDTVKEELLFAGIRDSKLFSKSTAKQLRERKEIAEFLHDNSTIRDKNVVYSMTSISVETINEDKNILVSIERGWVENVKEVMKKLKREFPNFKLKFHVIIDGNHVPKALKEKAEKSKSFTVEAMIKGDKYVTAISAASIIAKEWRDQYMTELAKEYPVYGFEDHFGYGTAYHTEMLHKHGKSKVHRYFEIPELRPPPSTKKGKSKGKKGKSKSKDTKKNRDTKKRKTPVEEEDEVVEQTAETETAESAVIARPSDDDEETEVPRKKQKLAYNE